MGNTMETKKVKFLFGLVTVVIKTPVVNQGPRYYLENDKRICLNIKSIKNQIEW